MQRIVFWFLVFAFLARPAFGQMQSAIPNYCTGAASTVAAGQAQTWTGSREIAGWVCVRGTLTLAGTLSADGIYVDVGGFLDVQSGAITFRNTPINLTADPRQWGAGLLVFGRVRMIGVEKTPAVRVADDVRAGQTVVTLTASPLGWAVGDEVFLPDTRQVPENDRFNSGYALRHETRTIAAISGVTVTLTTPWTYDHLGARDANGAATSLGGTRLLPHLANLTRSITLRSANPNGTRGHSAFTDRASVEIRNVAFRDMGRTTTAEVFDQDNSPNQIGRYPLHIHMLKGPVNPTNTGYQFQLTGNVVRDSRKWPIAIHGSHFGLVDSNVVVGGPLMTGSGIALEDGTETDNLIARNVVADIRGNVSPRNTGTGPPSNGLQPGSGGECIWAAGFNNRFVDNIVTGCRNTWQEIVSGVGFKFFVAPDPGVNNRTVPACRGCDPSVAVNLQNQPIREFRGNEAYGLMSNGLTIWHLGTSGYGWNASQAETVIDRFRVWHAYHGAIWNYPTNKTRIDQLVYRIDWAINERPCAVRAGDDYRIVDQIVTNADVQAGGLLCEDGVRDALGVHRYENNRVVSSGHAFRFETPATPGTGATRPSTGVSFFLINNVVTPAPGQPLRTVSMFHTTAKTNNDPNDPFIVAVTEGATTYRVCFPIQETQPLYGGLCERGTQRSDINGLVSGTPPPLPPPDDPPPPPPPPDDPPACTTITVQPTAIAWTVTAGQLPAQTTVTATTCNGATFQTNDQSSFYSGGGPCWQGYGTPCASGTAFPVRPYESVAALAPGTYSHPIVVFSSGLTSVQIPVTLTVTSAEPPPPPPPPAEVCGDGIDNDQDGQIDEGCPVTPPPPTCDLRITRVRGWPGDGSGVRPWFEWSGTEPWADFTFTRSSLTLRTVSGCTATAKRQ